MTARLRVPRSGCRGDPRFRSRPDGMLGGAPHTSGGRAPFVAVIRARARLEPRAGAVHRPPLARGARDERVTASHPSFSRPLCPLLVHLSALRYHPAPSAWEVRTVTNANWMLIATAAVLAISASACKKSEEAPAPAASASVEAPPPPPPVESVSAAPEVSAKPPTPVVTNVGGDISGCCSALKSEAAKAAAADKPTYASAAAVCDGLAASVKKGAIPAASAKRTVRAQLQRARSIPGACQ